MQWSSILAIYVLFWALSLFVALPFGVRNSHEAGTPLVPGLADGAPADLKPGRIVLRTTLVATVLFGLYYANYVQGWITVDAFNVFGRPPDPEG